MIEKKKNEDQNDDLVQNVPGDDLLNIDDEDGGSEIAAPDTAASDAEPATAPTPRPLNAPAESGFFAGGSNKTLQTRVGGEIEPTIKGMRIVVTLQNDEKRFFDANSERRKESLRKLASNVGVHTIVRFESERDFKENEEMEVRGDFADAGFEPYRMLDSRTLLFRRK